MAVRYDTVGNSLFVKPFVANDYYTPGALETRFVFLLQI
jgi:hypothetical protein